MPIQLAIIIPYYKNRYIKETLRSIEQQTNRNFRVNIGDDNSLHPIQPALDELADEFKQQISYHRFTDNLGSTALTRQWGRSINLSTTEPYIWLFSDDDTMPVDAVQRFYDFISSNPVAEVIRFNIEMINDEGVVTKKGALHPAFETAEAFAYRRLTGQCLSTACEFIFTRDIYTKKEGFVEFPLAWVSDDATWVKFAEHSGIFTIPGKAVQWRMGGFNISSDKSETYKPKLEAAILYLKFISAKYQIPDGVKFGWLFGQLKLLKKSFKIKAYLYQEAYKSGLFSKAFMLKQFGLRSYKLFTTKLKSGLNRLARN